MSAAQMTTVSVVCLSSVDVLPGALRAPCITLVSTPVLTTRASTYSVLRRLEPRRSMLPMVIGSGLASPARCRLPANLFVAALGCSHSTYPLTCDAALSCASSVAPIRAASMPGAALPLRLVSPSRPLVSTWQAARGTLGSSSCAARMSTSAGMFSWLVILTTSPTLTSVHVSSRMAPPRLQ